MKNFILVLPFSLLSIPCIASEIYQCNKNGSIIFQSKPCSGHTGKTTADHLKEEQKVRETRLAEIKEKEEKLQERLNQPTEKPSMFKATVQNLKSYFSTFWQKIKQLFSVE